MRAAFLGGIKMQSRWLLAAIVTSSMFVFTNKVDVAEKR